MKREQFLEPQFLLGTANLVLLLFLLFRGTASTEATPPPNAPASAASNEPDGKAAIDVATQLLSEGKFPEAFDMILVASRIVPSDPRVFDLVEDFIKRASKVDDESAIILAEELVGRADSLIYFQSPSNVAEARSRLTQLGSLFEPPTPEVSTDRLADIKALLAVAQDGSIAPTIRSQAVEQASAALDSEQLREVLAKSDVEESAKLRNDIEAVEGSCVAALFSKHALDITEWMNESGKLQEKAAAAKGNKSVNVSKDLKDHIESGYQLVQGATPFAASGVAQARTQVAAVRERIEQLQEQKNWLFNRQVLRLIRELESKNVPTMEKIGRLAELREERLTPYILRRHNELWDSLFEELSEDEKVEAVRRRVLSVRR